VRERERERERESKSMDFLDKLNARLLLIIELNTPVLRNQ